MLVAVNRYLKNVYVLTAQNKSETSLAPTCVYIASVNIESHIEFHVNCHRYVLVCLLRKNSVTSSDYLFNLLLIGDTGVGKTSLLLRFTVRIYLAL